MAEQVHAWNEKHPVGSEVVAHGQTYIVKAPAEVAFGMPVSLMTHAWSETDQVVRIDDVCELVIPVLPLPLTVEMVRRAAAKRADKARRRGSSKTAEKNDLLTEFAGHLARMLMLANGAAAEPSAAEKAAGLDAGLTLVQIGKMWHWHDEDGRITPGPRWEAGHSSVNTSEKVTT